jgi:hypothetical protein
LINGDDTVLIAQGEFAQSDDLHQEALERIGAVVANVVSVDAGTSGNPIYWLDLFALEGEPYGAFTTSRAEGEDTVLTLYTGSVATFADGMVMAQQNVTVDLDLIFPGVDPAGLQSLLEAALPQLDSVSDGKSRDSGTPVDVNAANNDALADNEAFAGMPGMVAEGSYVSPHHGFALTWNDEWTFDPAYEAPVVSDVNFDVDQVYLTVDSPQWVWFGFYALSPASTGLSFDEFLNVSATPSRLQADIGPTAELVVSRVGIDPDGNDVGALIIRAEIEGFEFVVYEEYRSNPSGSAYVAMQFLMLVDDVSPGLEATYGLSMEGGPVVTLFTFAEIEAVAANESDLQVPVGQFRG